MVDRTGRALTDGRAELALAAVLAVLQVVTALAQPMGPTPSLVLGAVCCLGVALCSRWASWGAVVCLTGLAAHLSVPLEQAGPVIYSGLCVTFIATSRHRYRIAGVVMLADLAIMSVLLHRDLDPAEMVPYLVAWIGLSALAWTVGLAVRGARVDERRRLTRQVARQRREIAAQLHDNVAHDLALIVMRVEQMQLAGAQSREDLEFIAETARRSSRQLRGLMGVLRVAHTPSTPMLRARSALQEATEQAQAHGIALTVMTEGDMDALPAVVQDTLARVLKEASNNIVKHTMGAGPASIMLAVDDSCVDLMCSNPTTKRQRRPGLGLVGIRERVAAAGGHLDINEQAGTWITRVHLPITN